jgi:hypothetical protein
MDTFFATFLHYVYGDELLIRIEKPAAGRATFTFHVPSEDACIDFDAFLAGTLAISDLRALARSHGRLTWLLRDMGRNGETVWNSASWAAGFGPAMCTVNVDADER